MNIADRLKTIRESQGLSKNQLAKLAEISQSYVSDIEAGKKNPTIDILDRLCKSLGITLIQLFEDSPDQSPPDLLQLIETAKQLSPDDRKLLNQFISRFKEGR